MQGDSIILILNGDRYQFGPPALRYWDACTTEEDVMFGVVLLNRQWFRYETHLDDFHGESDESGAFIAHKISEAEASKRLALIHKHDDRPMTCELASEILGLVKDGLLPCDTGLVQQASEMLAYAHEKEPRNEVKTVGEPKGEVKTVREPKGEVKTVGEPKGEVTTVEEPPSNTEWANALIDAFFEASKTLETDERTAKFRQYCFEHIDQLKNIVFATAGDQAFKVLPTKPSDKKFGFSKIFEAGSNQTLQELRHLLSAALILSGATSEQVREFLRPIVGKAYSAKNVRQQAISWFQSIQCPIRIEKREQGRKGDKDFTKRFNDFLDEARKNVKS